MSKKYNILLVLAALLCLALSASAVTSPYVVVKQNAQTIKTRSEVKDHSNAEVLPLSEVTARQAKTESLSPLSPPTRLRLRRM